MKTRDEYTGLSYDVIYRGTDDFGALHLTRNGDVHVVDVPAWCVPLAMEAEKNGDVILAQAIIREMEK